MRFSNVDNGGMTISVAMRRSRPEMTSTFDCLIPSLYSGPFEFFYNNLSVKKLLEVTELVENEHSGLNKVC